MKTTHSQNLRDDQEQTSSNLQAASLDSTATPTFDNASLQIDPFFQGLLPTHPSANRLELKDLILQHGGCYDPLIVWDQTGILLDGHHRAALIAELRAEGHQIADPIIVRKSFESRAAAAIWVFRNQDGKRPNWTPFTKAQLFLANKELVEEIEADAAIRMKKGKTAESHEKGRVIDLIADAIGVGRTTVYKAKIAATVEAEKKLLLDGERLIKFPKLEEMLKKGQATPKQVLSALNASDKAEAANKKAAEAKKELPSYDVVDGSAVNSILYGDSLETLKKLPSECVNLVFTSPPYPILGMKYGDYEYDGNFDKYLDYLKAVWAELYRILRDGGRIAINFDNTLVQNNERTEKTPLRRNLYADFDVQLRSLGFRFRDSVLWSKGNCVAFIPTARNVRSAVDVKLSTTYEYINVYSKGSLLMTPQTTTDDETSLYDLDDNEWYRWRNEIWEIQPKKEEGQGNHPCPFPLQLAERVIRLFSFRGDTVLDCFSGSGTTATAAVLHGRQFIGIDNDAESILASRNRIDLAIGKAKQNAAAVEVPPSLEGVQKETDVLRRFKTVGKHSAAAAKDAIGRSRRNRPVIKDKSVTSDGTIAA